RFALGAQYAAGEAVPPIDRLLSFAIRRDWHEAFLHAQERIAAKLGLPTPLDLPTITVTAEENSWATSVLSTHGLRGEDLLIGMHCTAAIPDKRWPAQSFGKLVLRLKANFQKLAVVSFGSANERRDADQSHEIAKGVTWIEGAGQWTIRETLAMLKLCHL